MQGAEGVAAGQDDLDLEFAALLDLLSDIGFVRRPGDDFVGGGLDAGGLEFRGNQKRGLPVCEFRGDGYLIGDRTAIERQALRCEVADGELAGQGNQRLVSFVNSDAELSEQIQGFEVHVLAEVDGEFDLVRPWHEEVSGYVDRLNRGVHPPSVRLVRE